MCLACKSNIKLYFTPKLTHFKGHVYKTDISNEKGKVLKTYEEKLENDLEIELQKVKSISDVINEAECDDCLNSNINYIAMDIVRNLIDTIKEIGALINDS